MTYFFDFGQEKCAVLHVEKCIINHAHFISRIPPLGPEDSDKYLGISQSSEILHHGIKEKRKVCTLAEFEPF